MATKTKKRCAWPSDDALMIDYHDNEWGVALHDDRRHFEFIILDGAQAGLSWRTILYKRDRYREVFDSFDPQKVARYKKRKIESLLKDAGIVRNRMKIESAIRNAKVFLEIQKEFGTFDAYVWQFVGGKTIQNRWKTIQDIPAKTAESDAMSKDLKKRGMNFVGSTILYAYMQAAGMVNDHETSCFRHKELR